MIIQGVPGRRRRRRWRKNHDDASVIEKKNDFLNQSTFFYIGYLVLDPFMNSLYIDIDL